MPIGDDRNNIATIKACAKQQNYNEEHQSKYDGYNNQSINSIIEILGIVHCCKYKQDSSNNKYDYKEDSSSNKCVGNKLNKERSDNRNNGTNLAGIIIEAKKRRSLNCGVNIAMLIYKLITSENTSSNGK